MSDLASHAPFISHTEGKRTESPSVCRLCGAYCGIRVELQGEQVVRVRGDHDHPDSRGYTCAKGRALPALHHSRERLDYPRIGSRRVDWDSCISDLAARLREIRTVHGNGAVGVYSGMGTFGDRAGNIAFQRFVAQLETPEVFTAASVDIFPLWRATELVTGFAREVNPLWEPERSPSVCLVFGQNIVVSHGYATGMLSDPIRRIQSFLAAGGEMWVFDPRRTETAAIASRHLAVTPGSDVVILAWLVRSVLQEGYDADELSRFVDENDVERLRAALEPFTVDVASRRSGIPVDTLEELLSAVRRSRRVACLSGTGVNFDRHAVLSEWLRLVLMIITGSIDHEDGLRCQRGVIDPLDQRPTWTPAPPEGRIEPGPASRPELARWMGEYPAVALVDEIEAGSIRGLIVFGGNPLGAFPDPDRTAAALASLDVLAVADIFDKPLTRMATHVLACADILEHADLVTRERSTYVPRLVAPLADRRPSWWIFTKLGRSLGVEILPEIDLDHDTDDDVLRATITGAGAEKVFSADTHGVLAERRDGWVHEVVLADRTWRVAPRVLIEALTEVLVDRAAGPLQLVSGRHVARMNSVAYDVGPREEPVASAFVSIHPDDAIEREIVDGGRVAVTADAGVIEVAARLDDRMRRGTVSITHGMDTPNVNSLIAWDRDVDPISGQPTMSGVAVDVRLVRPQRDTPASGKG